MIGRGISCDLRFNDQGVSRNHLKVTVAEDGATVEDLGSTNGTLLNGETLKGSPQLGDGDKLQFGRRTIKIRVEEIGDTEDDEPTMRRDDQWQTEETEESTPPQGVMAVWPRTELESALVEFTQRNCPSCRQQIPAEAAACPTCGHGRRRRGPLSITQPIRLQDVERRSEERHNVEIPVLYSSASLRFDAVARDLSSGGVFVASELLDHAGTACSLTLLPDGAPPVAFTGVVRHVIDSEAGSGGRPPGLGIRFTAIGPEAQQWLQGFLERNRPLEQMQPSDN